MDKATTSELLTFVLESIALVRKRFATIQTSDDFMQSDEGLEKLDAIAMRLQAIGEALKNLVKREETFMLSVADSTYWSKIIRTREIISHHYVDLDAETIFMICDEKIEELEKKILTLQNMLETQ